MSDITITINKKYRIEKAASEDVSRAALNGAALTKDKDGNPVCVASDGRCMAVVPVDIVDGEIRDGKCSIIPSDTIIDSRKKGASNISIDNNTESVTCGGNTRKLVDGIFPNWKECFPGEYSKPVTFHINARLLYNLSLALGDEYLTVTMETFKPEGEKIGYAPANTVKPLNKNGAYGLIMPCVDK